MTMHDGHRSRLRQRFRDAGLEGFANHEALELLLCYARARGNVNPLAHELIETFGSLKGVLEAGVDQLMSVKGVGEETATLLSLIVPLFRRYQEDLCREKKCLDNKAAAQEYCTALLTGLRTERFYVICLSPAMQVIGCRIVGEGSLSEVPAYPRAVLETALHCNAYAVILCHNHPGGVARPSRADLDVTHKIADLLQRLDIRVVDHFIVSDTAVYSMSQHNDILSDRRVERI